MKTSIFTSGFLLFLSINLSAQWTDYGSYIGPTATNHLYIDGLDGQNLYFENNGSFISSADRRGLIWTLDTENAGGDNSVGATLFAQYYDYVGNKFHLDNDFDYTNGSLMTLVPSNGRIGIGTDSPATKLHVAGGDFQLDDTFPFITVNSTATGNAGFAFEDGTSNRGLVYWKRSLDAIVIHRNSTASTTHDFLLDRANGNIGINTSSTPIEKLDVGGAIRIGTTTNTNEGTIRWTGSDFEGYKSGAWTSLTDTGGSSIWSLTGNDAYYTTGNVGIGTSTPAFDLQVAGNVDVTGELTAASDRQLKKNIKPINNALSLIQQLNPVSYDYRVDEFPQMNLADRKKMGLVAQEVESVLPNLVSEAGTVINLNGEKIAIKSVNYMEMVPVLIKAIQELQNELEQKDTEIARLNKLEGEVAELKAIFLNQSTDTNSNHAKE